MSKFNIGDIVCSKKTGLPAVGTVQGLLLYKCIASMNGWREVPPLWKELYPDCEDKLCILMEFNEPQRGISFSEFYSYHHEKFSKEYLKEAYEHIPKAVCAFYPEDDLELFYPDFRKDANVSSFEKEK